MSYPSTDRVRALTNQMLDAVTKPSLSYQQSQDSISPIFHNLPWLPTPPMLSTHLEPVELPGSIPAELPGSIPAETTGSIPTELPGSIPTFELPGSWPKSLILDQSDSDKNIYADIWLTEYPPPYSVLPPSPALSATSFSSNDSSATMHSAKSHISQSSQASQLSIKSRPARSIQSLKRKQAPQNTTLRQLRAKQSEAELRRIYEQQTDEYLEELFAMLGSPIQRPLSTIRE